MPGIAHSKPDPGHDNTVTDETHRADEPVDLRTLARLAWDSPWRVRRHLGSLVFGPWIRAELAIAGVDVAPGARFFGRPIVQRYRGSTIRIGPDAELRSSPRSGVLGISHPVILTTLASHASIEIGRSVGLSGTTLCAQILIRIGDRSLIGADAIVTDTDHHPLSGPRPKYTLKGVAAEAIIIGADVFIGARAIILKGSRIGDAAVVGAGSVVAGEVPPCAVVAGNPARVIASSR